MGWKILAMKHRVSDGYVVDVNSTYEKQDGVGYARKVLGNTFEGVPGPEYIPFEDLTENDVINWVKEALGPDKVLEIQTNVDAEALANKQEIENPTVEQGLPW